MPEKFTSLDNSRLETVLEVFHLLFETPYRTLLSGGGAEPLYRPAASPEGFHRIIFTRDYLSSALHEVAHWCLAGPQRREQEDYGYWYAPDGRDAVQQQRFEAVEVKPQALERIFAAACRQPFRVSADNLQEGSGASVAFKAAIHAQTLEYCKDGLPSRAAELTQALARAFDVTAPCDPAHYVREQLD